MTAADGIVAFIRLTFIVRWFVARNSTQFLISIHLTDDCRLQLGQLSITPVERVRNEYNCVSNRVKQRRLRRIYFGLPAGLIISVNYIPIIPLPFDFVSKPVVCCCNQWATITQRANAIISGRHSKTVHSRITIVSFHIIASCLGWWVTDERLIPPMSSWRWLNWKASGHRLLMIVIAAREYESHVNIPCKARQCFHSDVSSRMFPAAGASEWPFWSLTRVRALSAPSPRPLRVPLCKFMGKLWVSVAFWRCPSPPSNRKRFDCHWFDSSYWIGGLNSWGESSSLSNVELYFRVLGAVDVGTSRYD